MTKTAPLPASRYAGRVPSCVRRLGTEHPFGKDKLTSGQTLGVSYERRIGKKIKDWCGSQDIREYWENEWIEYDGKLAQPDKVVILSSGCALLFEVKLTWVDTSDQLAFYTKLLAALGHSVKYRVTVCKNLRAGVPRERIVRSLDDIYDGCVLQMRS
jgi:hypothetical protein